MDCCGKPINAALRELDKRVIRVLFGICNELTTVEFYIRELLKMLVYRRRSVLCAQGCYSGKIKMEFEYFNTEGVRINDARYLYENFVNLMYLNGKAVWVFSLMMRYFT